MRRRSSLGFWSTTTQQDWSVTKVCFIRFSILARRRNSSFTLFGYILELLREWFDVCFSRLVSGEVFGVHSLSGEIDSVRSRLCVWCVYVALFNLVHP